MRVISEDQEKLVLDLIQRGQLSEREIAEAAGVARGTVRSRKAGYRRKTAWGRCSCGAWCLLPLPCRACRLRTVPQNRAG